MSGASLAHCILSDADLSGANLSGADLFDSDLSRANLTEADLSGAKLSKANVAEALLSAARMGGADFSEADLSGANLTNAKLSGANLTYAKLSGANLYGSESSRADLSGADLSNATLIANLSDADLRRAKLSGANLTRANLSGTDLSAAAMDYTTTLVESQLNRETRLGDIRWNGVPLERIDIWPARLGDERLIAMAKNRWERITAYHVAARAYRGLSIALRGQGLLIPASDYRLREQVLERKATFLSGNLLGWVFSWLLNLVAGYGERPVRAFFAYLLVLFSFAGAYLVATNGLLGFGAGTTQVQPLQWYEALVLSVSAFHGRGFFQPVQSLGDPVAILAAVEAVTGLFIEITFIATFTQRFFGGR